MLRRLFLAALALLIASPASAQFIRIDSFRVADINSTGSTLVGSKRDGNTSVGPARWEAGTITLLQGIPDGVSFSSRAISGGGDIIVGNDFSQTPTAVATLIGNEYTDLTPPGLNDFGVNVISADGSTIAGYYDQEINGTTPGQAAVLDPTTGIVTILPMPPGHDRSLSSSVAATSFDGEVRVGSRNVQPFNPAAMRWDGDVPSEAPLETIGGFDPFSARAVDVSANGDIVLGWNSRGIQGSSDNRQELWLWSGSTITQLPPYPGYAPESFINWKPLALSADGRTVLASCGSGNGPLCLWDAENGWRFLPDLLVEAGVEIGTFIFSSEGFLSADGQVVVSRARDTDTGYWFTFIYGLTETRIVVTETSDEADLNPNDGECDGSAEVGLQCTLRAAIQTANAQAGADDILFEIEGAGPHVIIVNAALPALTEPTVFDGTTQPGYADRPVITVRGSGVSGDGFVLDQAESEIKGLAIGGFGGAGVRLAGPGGGRVEASYIGLGADGAATPNGTGVVVDDSPDHVLDDNVISGNTGPGVLITGASATGVVVTGSRIGTTADGGAALGNGAEGVLVDGAPGVRIGGATEAERNVIAGNGDEGVVIRGESASGVTVSGTFIGTDASGTTALPNGGILTTGVIVDGTPGAIIGGATEAEGNVIVGSVSITGPGADGARIQGNRINLSADGRTELDDEAFTGIDVRYASDVLIGGLAGTPGQAPGNVIVASGPDASGISVLGEDDPDKGPADGLRVLGNLIGTDASGTVAIPVGEEGVLIRGLVRNARIGQAGGGNLIVTDRDAAVVALDLGADVGAPDGLAVAANTIGMSRGGAALLGDVTDGIRVGGNTSDRGVENVTIGGSGEAGNRIAAETGIILIGGRTSGASVSNNVLGLLANGLVARDEAEDGITLLLANGVTLDGNVVAGFERGIVLASDQNVLTRNRVGTNEGGSVSRANQIGIVVPREVTGLGDPIALGNETVIGQADAGNVITGNASIGLLIGPSVAFQAGPFRPSSGDGPRLRLAVPDSAALVRLAARPVTGESVRQRGGASGATNTLVEDNRIGVNLSGAALGNGAAGVLVQDGRGTRLLGNTLAGGAIGVFIGATADGEMPGEVSLAGNTFRATQTTAAAVSDADLNVFTAVPLEPGGEPVGNTFEDNFGAAITFRLDEAASVGNQVRGATFRRNAGPSILLTNEGDTYPAFAPPPPEMYTAIADGQSATVRFRAGVTGEAEIFASSRCEAGLADGEPMTRVAGSSGLSTASVPITIAAPILTSYVAATITTPGDDGTTSAFSTCVRIADEDDVTSAPVGDGETGEVLDGVGIGVTITQNPGLTLARGTASPAKGGGGTLYALRYGPQLPPQPGPFEGSATAPDGSTVTPDAVASDRYWDLRADGLAGVTYDVCLDGAGVGGIQDPDRLVVVLRETTGHPWTPHPTTRDGSELCASGLAAWGEVGIGAVQSENPVPSEPEVLPETLAVTAYPNPSRGTAVVRLAVPTNGPVRAAVHDALGREVTVLHDGAMSAGETEIALPRLAPGVYVVRLSTPVASASAAVTVVR